MYARDRKGHLGLQPRFAVEIQMPSSLEMRVDNRGSRVYLHLQSPNDLVR